MLNVCLKIFIFQMISSEEQSKTNANENPQRIMTLSTQPFIDLLSPGTLKELDDFCSCTSRLSVDLTNAADVSLELSSIIEENMRLKSMVDEIEFVNHFIETSNSTLYEQTQEFRNAALNQQFDEFSNFLRPKINETRFLEQKSAKYRYECAKLNDEMKKRGLDAIAFDGNSSDNHWSILDRLREDDETIEKLRGHLKRLERKLAAFFDLPNDVHLARVKVEEKRLELENLEKELDAMIIDVNKNSTN